MKIINLHMSLVSSEFSVQRPRNSLFRLDHNMGRLKRIDQICIILCCEKGCHDLLKLQRILRICNQCHLKQSVIHIHILTCKILKASYGSGIADHTINKIILHSQLIGGYFQMIGFHLKKLFHSFQHIGNMSQDILQILISLIGNIGKQPKRSHIGKCLVIKFTDITVIDLLLHDHGCSCSHTLRHKQTVGKIIGASCRNITDGCLAAYFHDSGNHLIKCTVTAAAGDQIHLICIFLHLFISILRSLRGTDDHFISTFVKDIHNVQQMRLDPSFSCFGVENKKHSFFHYPILISRNDSLCLFFYYDKKNDVKCQS